MSKLVSSAEFKKSDGSPIVFNFQFENGLPVKPLFYAEGNIMFSEKQNKYGVFIKIDDSFDKNNFNIENVSFHKTNAFTNDIWVHLHDCYFVVKDIEVSIIEKLEEKGLSIFFINKNNKKI